MVFLNQINGHTFGVLRYVLMFIKIVFYYLLLLRARDLKTKDT